MIIYVSLRFLVGIPTCLIDLLGACHLILIPKTDRGAAMTSASRYSPIPVLQVCTDQQKQGRELNPGSYASHSSVCSKFLNLKYPSGLYLLNPSDIFIHFPSFALIVPISCSHPGHQARHHQASPGLGHPQAQMAEIRQDCMRLRQEQDAQQKSWLGRAGFWESLPVMGFSPVVADGN